MITNVQAFDKDVVRKSIVGLALKIGDKQGVCHGVVIKKTENYSTILTAKHCTKDVDEFYVEEFPAYLIKKSDDSDLAYLFVPGNLKTKEPCEFADNSGKFNQQVYYLGEVFGIVQDLKGRVIYTIGKTVTTLHVIRGNSGGGIWTEDNKLVGVIVTGSFAPLIEEAIISQAENLFAISNFLNYEVDL
ncbi:MAG: S1 family peptidase [Candidatus Helarchaeota archaeon]